jgi:hypothetical protein
MAVNNGQGEAVNPILAHPGLRALLQQQIAIRDGVAPANTPPAAVMPASSAAGPVAPPISLPAPATEASGMPSASPQSTNEAHLASLLGNKPALENVYHKITSSDFGQNHPVLGKLAGVAAQVPSTLADVAMSLKGLPVLGNSLSSIGQVMPGTTEQHNAELERAQNAVNQETANTEKGAQTAGLQAEVPLRQAETARYQQQTEAGNPIEISPEVAEGLGHPEWAGEKLTPAILAGLQKQAGINATKESTTGETVAGRENVAQTAAESREHIAETAAQSRERIASAANSVRQTLGAMRTAAIKQAKDPNAPTMTTQNMAQMAQTLIPQMQRINMEIDSLEDNVGPAIGRWNQLMVNKGGTDFPQFAALDSDLDLMASAIVRTHFGARGGQQYRQELRKQFAEAQSPADLKARMGAAEQWIQGYANAGHANETPAQGGGTNPPADPNPSGAKQGYHRIYVPNVGWGSVPNA